MATQLVCVGLLLAVAGASPTLPLPPYIKPCSMSDPQLNACALKHGREAVPHILRGDRKYKVPVFTPLAIDRLEVDNGGGPLGLAFVATAVKIHGLQDMAIDDITIDLKRRHVTYAMHTPRVNIECQYNVSGRVLVVPVVGNGDANITLEEFHLRYEYDYTLQRSGEEEFFVPGSEDLHFNTSRLSLRLGNLFGGDPLLGDTTNQALNDNWPEVLKSVGPVIASSVGQVITKILAEIFKLVPAKEVFLP